MTVSITPAEKLSILLDINKVSIGDARALIAAKGAEEFLTAIGQDAEASSGDAYPYAFGWITGVVGNLLAVIDAAAAAATPL
jgi:hypothetical protein